MIEQPFENGIYRTLEQDINAFFMDFDLADIDFKVRVISRKFLKKYPDYIPRDKDHGIYILVKDNFPVYVGQSKNFNNRMSQHNLNNTSSFDRCFIFFKPQKDLRGLLDYMESYTIHSIEERGITLNNVIRLNPDEDVLVKSKKILSRKWIEAFIAFLPCLGVSLIEEDEEEYEETVKRKKQSRGKIHININNIEIGGDNNTLKVINFIKYIGIDKISYFLNEINSQHINFRIEKYDFSDSMSEDKKLHKSNDEYGKTFWFQCNLSTNLLVEKIKFINKKIGYENSSVYRE